MAFASRWQRYNRQSDEALVANGRYRFDCLGAGKLTVCLHTTGNAGGTTTLSARAYVPFLTLHDAPNPTAVDFETPIAVTMPAGESNMMVEIVGPPPMVEIQITTVTAGQNLVDLWVGTGPS